MILQGAGEEAVKGWQTPGHVHLRSHAHIYSHNLPDLTRQAWSGSLISLVFASNSHPELLLHQ